MQPRLFSCAYQSGTPTFLFNAMQISKKSQSLTMNAADRQISFQHTCVHIHSTYTHIIRAHGKLQGINGSDLDQNLKYFQSLKVQLHFQKPRQA